MPIITSIRRCPKKVKTVHDEVRNSRISDCHKIAAKTLLQFVGNNCRCTVDTPWAVLKSQVPYMVVGPCVLVLVVFVQYSN